MAMLLCKCELNSKRLIIKSRIYNNKRHIHYCLFALHYDATPINRQRREKGCPPKVLKMQIAEGYHTNTWKNATLT